MEPRDPARSSMCVLACSARFHGSSGSLILLARALCCRAGDSLDVPGALAEGVGSFAVQVIGVSFAVPSHGALTP
ncbi:MAG: hypothetical protein JWN04_2929 [Myxococcaceae bacterium]|nr:hypothetical protein [Myxococcaceae bacterium]